MAEEGFNEQQQQQKLVPEDLDFSLNDILNGSTENASFQSIVQGFPDTGHDPNIAPPSFAHLPAELQDFFSASETDDLLSNQHADILFESQPPFIQQPAAMRLQPNVISNNSPLIANLTPPPPQSPIVNQPPVSSSSQAQFMSQAKTILGQQQYRQLEDLKSKPITQQLSEEDQRKRKLNETTNHLMNTPQLKRPKSEHIPNNNQTIYPPRMPQQQNILSQQQQQQLQLQQQSQPPQQHIQPSMVTPNIVKPPVFKTPAVPGPTPILQIPSKSNAPTPPSKPASTAAQNMTSGTPTTGGGGGGGDRVDYEALTDVMGYAGVDLKEEAEHFMKEDMAGTVLPDGMDRSKFQDFMNPTMLKDKILKYAKSVNIKKIDSDFVSYVALATQDRIRTVMENMVRASRHRTQNVFKKPPEGCHYKIQVKQRVKDQLKAIEKVESHQTSEDEDMPDISEGWYSKQSRHPLPNKEKERKITIEDAIFVMERDVQGGRGTNRRTLLKAYNTFASE
ncbi:hypothetical protein G6F57_004084 [Rhizopus arrhizus]|uniref:Transcription initiation factor TFIID subunit 4 n=1 Tax=Rhizopus oryzae TaxID=64495 RepID=A0A9P7BUN6_RHIOR|nr:hypothetical protein G6F24_003656 [Rhizopus arrhizus]KAG1421288.1 hypothetical protein G6F58_003802 [Rhizopus delemar]KAG0787708.1 hypothetical protein G6F22_007228 [Rhizopus arrhizus]KAG0793502.1 hypothetical protein G6F21_003570 [Rhizopus arrhizus]KAG0819280.1 hypothetical protein G6F20_000901 [Rhizopus arrhizus]